jgi:addiction module RelB/DinJ family antitoxin
MATNTKTLLTIKIDKKLKEAAKKTAAEFGLPLGTMVNMLLRDTTRRGELDLELRPTPRLRRSIREAEREWKSGKMKVFNSAEELIADLHKH